MATPILCKGCGQTHDPLRLCLPKGHDAVVRLAEIKRLNRLRQRRHREREREAARAAGVTIMEYRLRKLGDGK